MKTVNVLALLGLVLILVGCSKEEMPEVQESLNLSATTTTGNDAPNGAHYNLNIIGTSEKSVNMGDSNGHVIFVPLVGQTDILLMNSEENGGDEFAVLDANGTDGTASFQLPPPGIDAYEVGDGDADTHTDYSVFVRPLGKPGGWSTITTVAELVDDEALMDVIDEALNPKEMKVLNSMRGDSYASIEMVGQAITERKNGKGNKSTFTNVTAQLLTIVLKVEYTYDDDNDPLTEDLTETVYVRVPIFHDMLEGEYWEYDNKGLRILQVRFYPGYVSNVTDWDDKLPKLN